MSEPTVLSNHQGGVLRLTLNRPARLNAFTRAMLGELRCRLEGAAIDPTCRVIVLTGAGRAFRRGRTSRISEPGASSSVPDAANLLEVVYNPLIKLISTMPKPVIAAVNGIAGRRRTPMSRWHAISSTRPAVPVFCRLSRALALSRMPAVPGTCPVSSARRAPRRLAMLAEPLSAEQAEAWGLIWKVVDDDKLAAEVEAVSDRLASAATHALASPSARSPPRAATRLPPSSISSASCKSRRVRHPTVWRVSVPFWKSARPGSAGKWQ